MAVRRQGIDDADLVLESLDAAAQLLMLVAMLTEQHVVDAPIGLRGSTSRAVDARTPKGSRREGEQELDPDPGLAPCSFGAGDVRLTEQQATSRAPVDRTRAREIDESQTVGVGVVGVSFALAARISSTSRWPSYTLGAVV